MNASEVIERLCKLQEEVQSVFEYQNAADCFCGKGVYWNMIGYDGTYDNGYRNDGKALEFIEQAVREKLSTIKNKTA